MIMWLRSKASNWRNVVGTIMATPLVVAIVLLILDINLTPEQSIAYLSYVFATTAGLAVFVSVLVTHLSFRAWRTAVETHEPEDAARLVAFSKLLVNASLLIVHLLFLAAGIAAVSLAYDSFVRIEITRLSVVVGQIVLLSLGLSVYVLHHHIRKDVMEKIEEEKQLKEAARIEGKIDEAAEVARGRHKQYTDEHYRMLCETKAAAEAAKARSEEIIKILARKGEKDG